MAEIPQPSYEEGLEDTQSIDSDIETLFQKFIKPIDDIRSIAEAPSGTLQSNQKQQILSSLKVNAVKPIESRCSAFYRMIGLPVVAQNDSFYNPGFNPTRESEDRRNEINTNISSDDLVLLQFKETNSKFFQSVFARQDMAASILSLVAAAEPKKFNTLENEDQTFKITERTLEVDIIKKSNSNISESIDSAAQQFANTAITPSWDGGIHLLKPFMVDPSVDFTVMPVENKVCVPFLLDQQATKLSTSPDVFCLRPGVEYILRARLIDTVPDTTFLTDLENILTQQKKPTQTPTTSADALFSTIVALADENNVDSINLNEIFGGFTSTQAVTVRQLIKTIKAVVNELYFSTSELDKVRQSINFIPLPGVNGPESPGKILDTAPISQIDNSILQLTIKQLNAEREVSIREGLGKFATPFMNLEKVNTYDQQLQTLKSLKNDLGNRGLEHLKRIEIITGEFSGLGLVDVLAIYTALWSINIDSLLGLLDTDSLNRLYNNNVSLRTTEVTNQFNGIRPSVRDALEKLEERVTNILSFADKVFSLSFSSPQEAILGEP